MEDTKVLIQTNRYQTPVTQELLDSLPSEVAEQLMDCLTNIQFIKNLISPDRPYYKDLPRDERGAAIVDITNPPILEDADYFRQAALHYQKHGCYTFLKPNSNPNSEFRKFWDEERRRCWEGLIRPSDGAWISGFNYWFLNYQPMMVNKITEGRKKAVRVEAFPFIQEGNVWRYYYLFNAREQGHHAIELAKRGAHPYSQKVFTPKGWRTWGEIQIGDELYGTYGNITKVIDIPYDKECDVYEITLRDGRKILASDEHLWKVDFHNRRSSQIMTTLELLKEYKRDKKVSERNPSGIEYVCAIHKNEGIEMPYKETKVDPYTFGLVLGDGCFVHRCCYYTQLEEDVNIEKQYIPYNLIKWNNKYAYRIDIPKWSSILKEYGLYWKKSEDKFIPDEYKYNSREVRLNLLKGLMDSDGTLDKSNRYIISLSSKKLIEDIAFICRSLGYNCSYTIKKTRYKVNGVYKECLPSYSLTIFTRDIISNLPRKQKRAKKITNEYTINKEIRTKIIDIKYIGKQQAKCVTVDSKDNCYLIGDFVATHNCAKSYSLSAIMGHNLILGESEESRRRVITVLTAYQKEYLSDNKDGTLSKFKPAINFSFSHTPFPHLMLKNSPNEMSWQMGYKDEYGIERGSLNQVLAVSAKDDSEKLRGKRGWILFEEMGSFKGLLSLYDITRKSVEDGDYTFATMYLVGTAAEDESDFSSAKTLLYYPEAYNILSVENVYDRPKQGKPTFGYFFPSYVNRAGCYNKDGVSDVVKALIEILMQRHKAKYSADPKSVLRVIAEDPITPAEAIIKVKAAFFPVTALTERLQQLDTDVHSFDDVYIGKLVMNKSGEVEFKPTSDEPIRKYGVENDTPGAIEIFELPEKDRSGKVPNTRYIIGHDPVDNDQAESSSLSSTFVLDLWTDKIVAEYTGRQAFAEDNFEIVRLLCLFYNAKCLYESNKKGIYAYFAKMNCTHLLADTPEYLRDKQMIKYSSFGSNAHPYNQLVRTPNGIKQWGDIKVGDYLYSINGTVTKVVDIPIDEELDIYRITLRDGRTIEASEGHLWEVWKGSSKIKRKYLKTTKEIQNDIAYIRENSFESKYYIRNAGAIQYEEQNIPMNPYLLGLMIGDGSMSNKHTSCGNKLHFTSTIEDMKFYGDFLNLSYRTTDNRHHVIDYPNWGTIVKQLGLDCKNSHTKFIPDIYKYNTYNVRLNILQGLLDTDGSCPLNGGCPTYCTVSNRLAEDVIEVARSLGINCNKRISYNKYGLVYEVIFYTNIPIFKLPRKLNRQQNIVVRTRDSFIGITSIEYVGKKKAKCVTVDRNDGLYLIGDFVITHNCKGVNATAAINNYANGLIRDWLMKPVTMITTIDGVEQEVVTQNLFFLRNRALIEELIAFNPEINVDRIRALGMVMLYREEKMVLYQGNPSRDKDTTPMDYIGNDPFFTNNYDKRFKKSVNLVKDIATS